MNLQKGEILYIGAAGAVSGLICMWAVVLTKVSAQSLNDGQSAIVNLAMWISLPMFWITDKLGHLGFLGREDFGSVLLLLSLYWMLIGALVVLVVYCFWHSLLHLHGDRNRP